MGYCQLGQGLLSIRTGVPYCMSSLKTRAYIWWSPGERPHLKIRVYVQSEMWKFRFCLEAFRLSMRASAFCFKIEFFCNMSPK